MMDLRLHLFAGCDWLIMVKDAKGPVFAQSKSWFLPSWIHKVLRQFKTRNGNVGFLQKWSRSGQLQVQICLEIGVNYKMWKFLHNISGTCAKTFTSTLFLEGLLWGDWEYGTQCSQSFTDSPEGLSKLQSASEPLIILLWLLTLQAKLDKDAVPLFLHLGKSWCQVCNYQGSMELWLLLTRMPCSTSFDWTFVSNWNVFYP